jgi:hypothetical protein
VIDHVDQLWNQLLGAAGSLVSPDWGSVVNLLPLLLVIGVLGPVLTIMLFVWFIYFVRAPRTRVRIDEGPRQAPLDDAGRPDYPAGLPYCPRDQLVYPSGTTTCDVCHDDLLVRCPMCGIGRLAGITTCGNCGLVLRVEPRARVLRPAGPPPGGASAA